MLPFWPHAPHLRLKDAHHGYICSFPLIPISLNYTGPRSPLPHMMRESRPAPKGSSASLPPPAAAAPRTKTRFDQPATRSPKNSRGPLLPRTQDDVYIPDDLIPIRRERDSELTSVQIGVEQHEATRRRQNTDEHAPNRRSGLPPLSLPDFDQSSAYLQERSVSGSGDSHSPANAAESQSRMYSPAFDYYIVYTNFCLCLCRPQENSSASSKPTLSRNG